MSSSPVFYALLVTCLLLGVGLTAAAIRRPNRQRLVARLLASWLGVAGFWCLAFPPHRSVPGSARAAIILTPGYESDTLRHLLQQLGPATRVWRMGFTTASDTPTLSSLQFLGELRPKMSQIHLLGQGLPAAELAEADSLPLIPHWPAPKARFQHATWSRRLPLGNTLTVAGVFGKSSTDKQPVWISLQGPGRNPDSTRLAEGSGAFRLHFLPRATGPTLYQLVARQGGNIIATEPVPVEITASQSLRVLLLSSTASFEFKFLKNYLSAQQHQVALRTGLSRGLAQTEFLNQPAQDLSRLTSALLARYDVLVADAGSVSALSAGEAQLLQNVVRTTGLGLVLLADAGTLPRQLPGRSFFTVQAQPVTATQRPQPIRWPESPTAASAVVPATLRLQPPARALVEDARRQAVVGTQRLGLGSVTVSTLPQTYPWVLQEATATYAAFWSQLLQAARPLPQPTAWQVLTTWPRSQEPLLLRLTAATLPPAPPTVTGPQLPKPVALPLSQDAWLPEWSTGQFWPRAAGWHQAQLEQQLPHLFYVYGPHDWLGPELISREQALASRVKLAAGATASVVRAEPYPLLWFFLLVLLSAGFLWLEEKL